MYETLLASAVQESELWVQLQFIFLQEFEDKLSKILTELEVIGQIERLNEDSGV